MKKASTIYTCFGILAAVALVALTVFSIVQGDIPHAVCDLILMSLSVLLVIVARMYAKMRDLKDKYYDEIVSLSDTVNRQNKMLWELSECGQCFFGVRDEYGIKCAKHNCYYLDKNVCIEKITKEEIPARAQSLRGFVNGVTDEVLLDSLWFNDRPCRFDNK